MNKNTPVCVVVVAVGDVFHNIITFRSFVVLLLLVVAASGQRCDDVISKDDGREAVEWNV